jgi:hypothetical protein
MCNNIHIILGSSHMFKKIAFAAVGLSLLASPFIASAQVVLPQLPANPTIADLQNEIQELILIVTQLIALHGGNQGGGNTNQIQLSASATPSIVQNSAGTVQIRWDVRNAPSGSAIEIGIAGISGEDSVALSNILSTFPLDGTTGTVDLTAGHTLTSVPSHGTINFPAQYFSGLLPISGPLKVTVLDSSGNVIAQTSVPLQIVATAPSQIFTASPTSGAAPLQVVFTASPNTTIVFGDGTAAGPSADADAQFDNWSCDAAGPSTMCFIKHQYTSAGTYTAKLLGTPIGGLNNVCIAGVNCNNFFQQTLGTQTITVTSASANTNSSLIATNPNPIQYSITSSGTTGVTVGSFTLQPSGENVNLQQIGLDLPAQQASPSDITRAYVYQGSSLLGTVIFTGSATSNCPPAFTGIQSGGCYFATTTVSSTLSQNTQANFTIKADIAPIGVGQPGTSGDQIVVGLSDAEGSGANSGATIHSGSAPAQVGVRIFKSYPVVTLVPLNSTNVDFSIGKQPALLRFSVTASPNGPIGLAYLTPRIVANGITFSSVTTYAYTDPSYSQPVAGTASSGGNLGTVNPSSGLTGSFSIPISNGSVPLEIPAGQTYYFQIVGNTASTQGNVSVITTLPGDTAYVPVGSYNGNVARFGSNANFVWSPNDLNTSQFADNDWTNGLGIPGLPLNGISQTRTGSGTQNCPAGTSGTYPNCSATIPNPFLTFSAVPANVPSGASASLDWTASYTGLCTITNTSTGVALDLTHANDNTFAAGYSSVSTGALSQTTIFELRCALLTGATSGYAVKDVTVSVTPIPFPSATVTYTGISGGTVTGTYANIPATSTIIVINQTSGQPVSGIGLLAAGNGTLSLANIPSGAFYLKAVSSSGAYLAQSVVFYSSGPSPVPFACPVYQQLLCPSGQSLQIGAVTYDTNGCQIPHNSCVPTAPPTQSFTPTCSYRGSTINIEGGSDACRGWCLSIQAESPFGTGRAPIGGALSDQAGGSCVFQDSSGVSQTVAVSTTANANLANALTALVSALQAFLGK